MLLYTVCVVKQGQSLFNSVPLSLFCNEYKKVERNLQAASSVEKPKPVAFCVVNPTFIFHLWF